MLLNVLAVVSSFPKKTGKQDDLFIWMCLVLSRIPLKETVNRMLVIPELFEN